MFFEKIAVDRHRRSVPLRICVTGTRGKSTVTRLIAASLREAGLSVLVKTTGSKPVIIFSDGSEKEIRRNGPASILEQKAVLRLGYRLGVQALVTELMAIQPESLAAESGKIFQPKVLVITNVRPDHLEEMGNTKEKIVRSLCSAIVPGTTVFIPEEESGRVFEEVAAGKGVDLRRVRATEPTGRRENPAELRFEQNERLALAVADFLGIEKDTAVGGLVKASPDFGSLKAWKFPFRISGKTLICVSAFAANEPESTRKVLSALWERIALKQIRRIGLLNFREDRGERTLQWLKAIREGEFPEFDRYYLMGAHLDAAGRYLEKRAGRVDFSLLGGTDPEKIMGSIRSEVEKVEEDAILIGMGNMRGLGSRLVEFWERSGESYGL